MRTGRLQSVYHRPPARGPLSWISGGLSAIAARKRAVEEDAHLEAALEAALNLVLAAPGGGKRAFYGIGDALGPAIDHAAGFVAKSLVDGLRFVHFRDTPETRSSFGSMIEIEPCAGPISGDRIFETCRRLDLPRAAIVLIDPRQERVLEATASLIGTVTDERSLVILGTSDENEAIMPRLLTGNGWTAEVLLRFGRDREGRVLALRTPTPHLQAVGAQELAPSP